MKLIPLLLMGLTLSGQAIHEIEGANLLFLMPIGARSHMQFFGEIATTLADTGHQITAVTSYSMKNHRNITEVDVKIPLDTVMPNNFVYSKMHTGTYISSLLPNLCSDALSVEEVQKINVSEFDLVFMSASMEECFLSMLEENEVPLIYMNNNMMVSHVHGLVGNVDFPSFVTSLGFTGTHPLTFGERLVNTLVNTAGLLWIDYIYNPNILNECKRRGLCREEMKSFDEISSRYSIVMTNSIRTLEVPPRPHVPGVIHAGGLNLRPAQPLPQELESWIQGSSDAGFIYMSLGSIVKPSDMPEECRKILIEVFASLPQRIVWKWDQETMEDLPANVKLAKWLPQQDILGHPKIRVFMSHGGLFSIYETIYHGVPILGLPVFQDQQANVDRSVAEGFAEVVEWDHFTAQILSEKLTKILTQKSYGDAVKERSVVIRDQPMSPQETVIYWTEYVLRHKGASHLRSPVKDMPWYKLYNVDVWTVILVSLVVLLLLLLLIVWKTTSFLFRRFLRLFRAKQPEAKANKKKKTH